ncbi:MAG TPA: hypothetical protein VKB76_09150 [Ktedonobacterales bacterium]|nr:hypothetical protein [Ktedonobacterales bacterium]
MQTNIRDYQTLALNMEAGDEEQAKRCALLANEAVQHNPTIRLALMVDGCDDDPRELDQIPKGIVTLKTLFRCLTLKAFFRFDQTERGLMCVASGHGERHGTQLLVPDGIAGLN